MHSAVPVTLLLFSSLSVLTLRYHQTSCSFHSTNLLLSIHPWCYIVVHIDCGLLSILFIVSSSLLLVLFLFLLILLRMEMVKIRYLICGICLHPHLLLPTSSSSMLFFSTTSSSSKANFVVLLLLILCLLALVDIVIVLLYLLARMIQVILSSSYIRPAVAAIWCISCLSFRNLSCGGKNCLHSKFQTLYKSKWK